MSRTEQSLTSRPIHESVRSQRIRTCLQIVLPFLLALIIVVGIVATTVVLDSRQSALIADWMFTIFVLCPAVICLIPIFLLLVAGMWGIDWVNRSATSKMQRLEELSRIAEQKVAAITDQVDETIINANDKLEPIMKRIDRFDHVELNSDHQTSTSNRDEIDQEDKDEPRSDNFSEE